MQLSIFNNKISFSPKRSLYAVITIAVIFSVGYFFFSANRADSLEDYTVIKTNLKQYVQVTGSVKPSQDANLAFQAAGVVARVFVENGDVVKQGQALATLSSSDQEVSLLQARSKLDNAQATLDQLTYGARAEEVAIKQQLVDNANASLVQSYGSIPDAIRNVDATTADIIKNKLSTVFTSNGNSYIFASASCDQTAQSFVEKSRNDIEGTLADFQKLSAKVNLSTTNEELDTIFEKAYQVTITTNTLVSGISSLLLSSCSLQNTSLNTARASLSTIQTTMNTLFADITAKRSALNGSKNALSQAKRDLDLIKAGTDPFKIRAQAAVVKQAEADVKQAESALAKTRISAPFTGAISDVSISVGESVTIGKSAVSMLATDAYEIEAKVPEIDIVKIILGAQVDVTLDAYGRAVVFPAVVTSINPSATIEGTVPVYKVLVTFKDVDSRIKSGMTANVNIITENKEGSLTVPARFVTVIDETKGTVTKVIDQKTVVEQDVVLGIRGSSGEIEILSGLSVDDIIRSPEIGARGAQKLTK